MGKLYVQVDEARATCSWAPGGPLGLPLSGAREGHKEHSPAERTWDLASAVQGLLEGALQKGWEGREGKKLTVCHSVLTGGLEGKFDRSY